MGSLRGRGLRQTDAACCARDSAPRGTRRRTFKRTYSGRCPMTMNSLALVLALFAPAHPAVKPSIQYTLRIDSTDLSGWTVEIRLRTTSDTFRLAMAAHPEYDDRYRRYVRDVTVEPLGTVTRVDSAVWQVTAPRGFV